MFVTVLLWGAIAGIVHFVAIGVLYGNPLIDKQYSQAAASNPAVKKWNSKPKYLFTQFLGTQVEVYILTFSYLWLRTFVPMTGFSAIMALGLLLTAIRVYPRFWNMWIQSTYPNHLLAIEFVNGIIGTLVIASVLEKFAI